MNLETVSISKKQGRDKSDSLNSDGSNINTSHRHSTGVPPTSYRPKSPPPVKYRSASKPDSSKEYFTLQFYDDEELPLDTEKVPVRKGKSLKESIELVLFNHGVDFSTHSVFLEASKTPLPLMFDTFPLGGNTLHVKENRSMQVDERIITLMKEEDKKPQNPRQKKLIYMFTDDNDTSSKASSLTRETSNANNGRVKYSNSIKDLTKTNLTDTLAQYEMNGFTLENEEVDGIKDADIVLEDSWTDVITEEETMLREEKIQQEAIWELLLTERNYLRILRLITQVFQHCLKNLQYDSFLTELEDKKLFSNIGEIYNTNRVVWKDYMMEVIADARQNKKPIKPSQLRQTFSNFGELFEPYISYCLEESTCVKYLKHLKKHDEHFEEYLTWCENRPQCNRLKLQDLLVKPMQRITKYGLLLKAILHKTRDEQEKQAVNVMLVQVENFVMKINTTMRTRHEQHKLNDVLSRIDFYYPVEPVNEDVERIMLEYCSLDLHGKIPGLPESEQRCILLEAPMKMTEKHGKSEVHVFLFTDVLIITKPKKGADKLRIVRQPYRLNKVIVRTVKEANSFLLVYLNEYRVLVSAFTLQVTATDFLKWIQAIERAKNRYLKARAGQGSTLDFYDDDIFASGHSNDYSPMPERHPIILPEDSSSLLIADSAHLRSRSSVQITNAQTLESPAVAVKRSASDPKSGSWNRDKRKHRPMSLISASDCDTASWVLTNEKRNRSDSIPSDMSEDSRRSSGIGDSFRSINSDSAIHTRAGNLLTKTYTSNPEVSNVMKLKERFEHGDSSSTDGSNNSISKTNNADTRQTTPPDFLENHSTIQEEEEHCSNNGKTSETSDQNPYENIDLIRSAMLRTPKTDTDLLNTATIEKFEKGIQCNLIPPTQHNDTDTEQSSSPDLHDSEDKIRIEGEKYTIAISTQCLAEEKLLQDVGTQYETSHQKHDACTQCGDFIQLAGVSESDTDDGDIEAEEDVKTEITIERPSSAPPSSVEITNYDMPMMSMLNPSLIPKQPKSILKHSFSEANIPLAKGLSPELEVVHSRSRSDEPKQSPINSSPRQKHRNSTSTYDFPGMRALQTLSESLESSLQSRQSITNEKTSEHYKNVGGRSESPLLNRTTISNHSPLNAKKTFIETETHGEGRVSPISELVDEKPVPTRSNTGTFAPLREHANDKQTISNSKRNTWHDFDSMQALQEIERTKYGSQGRLDKISESLDIQSLNRTQSQSTEYLDGRRRKSVKKPFFKKFSSASAIEPPQDNAFSDQLDEKSLKKLQKKEKERIKKEKKLKDKEEKKREKKDRHLSLGKLRSNSFSSTNSSKSTLSKLSTTAE